MSGRDLAGPLETLARAFGGVEPLTDRFVDQFRAGVDSGSLEVLIARVGERIIGVAIIAYRLNVSAGSRFASIEDLYVDPDYRRQSVGRELLRMADETCSKRGISYVEVQAEDPVAKSFYTACGYGWEMEVKVMSRSRALEGEVRDEVF